MGAARAEQPVLEQPHIHDRSGPPQLDDHQQAQQHHPGDNAAEHFGRRPSMTGSRRNPVHRQPEPGRGEQEAGGIESARLAAGVPAEKQGAEYRDADAHRNVDIEDQAPGQVGHQKAAEHGAERRCESRRKGEHGGETDTSLRPEGAQQHGHADRREHAAARPLQHPEQDELAEARGHPTQRRRDREDRDGRQQRPLAAEPVAEPPRCRNEDSQADQVGDRHHVDRRGLDRKGPADGREGHIDDGGVHRAEENGGNVDDSDRRLLADGAPHATLHACSFPGTG